MNYKTEFNGFGEKCIVATHKSGLKIFILPKPKFSSYYAVFGVKYGSIDTKFSTDGIDYTLVPEGIAHFLEHKLFESEDGDAFTKYAATGASANAFTSFDRTCYLFGCSDKFEENLKILLDFVQKPYFTEKTVKKEQGIIGQEIQMYDDSPGWCSLFNMLESMYKNNPVRIDIAGTKQSISKITDKLLYECYDTFYNPSNMYLCLAGNIDIEKTLDIIDEEIVYKDPIDIKRGTFDEPDWVSKNFISKKMSVAIPIFNYGFKIECKMPDKTLKEKISMGVAIDYLIGECSETYRTLIENGLINDEFDAEYFTGNNYAAVIFSGESEHPKTVKNIIDTAIKDALNGKIDNSLLSTVKKGMYGDYLKKFNSVSEITMHLVECAMNNDGVFDEAEIIKNITESDVLNSLKLLNKDNSVLSVIYPENKE